METAVSQGVFNNKKVLKDLHLLTSTRFQVTFRKTTKKITKLKTSTNPKGKRNEYCIEFPVSQQKSSASNAEAIDSPVTESKNV